MYVPAVAVLGTIIVNVALPVGVIGVGTDAQLLGPVTVRVTGLLNPSSDVAVIVELPDKPA